MGIRFENLNYETQKKLSAQLGVEPIDKSEKRFGISWKKNNKIHTKKFSTENERTIFLKEDKSIKFCSYSMFTLDKEGK
jgi:hypothetical protein